MLERIAEEHKRGRRLIVVTTRTSMRSAAWSGAIAGSSRPDRLDIFRNVLVASASIPGVFAPVLIEVVANGRMSSSCPIRCSPPAGSAVGAVLRHRQQQARTGFRGGGEQPSAGRRAFLLDDG